jgi:uncharacterized membrane protein YphA (DoxX/SURF4 family)
MGEAGVRFVQIALIPAYILAAAALVVTGVAKVRRPKPTATALAAAGLPSGTPPVVLIAITEICTGLVCLIRPSAPAALAMFALYAAFALFLVRLMRRGGPGASCGCFGDTVGRSVPASYLGVAVDLVAAAASGFIAVRGVPAPPALPALMAHQPLLGAPFVAGIVLAGYLAFLAVAYLPGISASVRRKSV